MRLIVHFEGGNKRILWNVDLAKLAHLFFAFFLLIQQFALPAHIASVTFGRHILAQGGNGFARDNFTTKCRLERNFKQMARDQIF